MNRRRTTNWRRNSIAKDRNTSTTNRKSLGFEPLEERHMLAVLTVNTLLDLNRAGDGLVSLREAIVAANTDMTTDLGQTGSGVDSIEFGSLAGDIQLTLGEMQVLGGLTIDGPGQDLLTIDAQHNSRVFNISGGSGDAITIAGLTLTRGNTDGDGGAILAAHSHLTLIDCKVDGNSAGGHGGGIFSGSGFPFAFGSVSLVDSVISGNTATSSGGGIGSRNQRITLENSLVIDNSTSGPGGGIATLRWRSPEVELFDSVIEGNFAAKGGGGIYGERVYLTDSVVTGNTTAHSISDPYTPIAYRYSRGGGGITAAQVELLRSSVTDNVSLHGDGGGVSVFWGGTAKIESSTVSNNSAGKSGGGIFRVGSDGTGTLEINDSVVSGNSAVVGGGIFGSYVELGRSEIHENIADETGGGIRAIGPLAIVDSTIRDNVAGGDGGGIHAIGFSADSITVSGNVAGGDGGGVRTSSIGTIVNSTVSGNSAADDGGGIFAYSASRSLEYVTVVGNRAFNGNGGGIWCRGGDFMQTVAFSRSIFAGNSAGIGGPDLHYDTGTISLSHSLIGDNAGTSFDEAQSPDANGNLIGSATGGGIIDPRLGPLADNGGPTPTHALLPGSPAIDAIPHVVEMPLAPAHEYQLNGSLADANGGPALVALGGTLTATRYQFGLNQGLNLSLPSIDPAEYTIEIVFSWNNLSGTFQKIIDFNNLTADTGLYTYGNGLRFFDKAFTPNLAAGGHLVLTRDDATDTVRAYVYGDEVWNFVDTAGDAVFSGPDQIIRFFQDDTVTGQFDAESGSVDRIRIYDQVLDATEVAELLNPPPPSIVVPPFDQRGEPYARIVDGDEVGGAAIDMGAYESQGIPSFSPGDYNENGIVDTADYTVWRDTLNQSGLVPFSGADGDGNGEITTADYEVWKSQFGDLLVITPPVASGESAAMIQLPEADPVTPSFIQGHTANSAATAIDLAFDFRSLQQSTNRPRIKSINGSPVPEVADSFSIADPLLVVLAESHDHSDQITDPPRPEDTVNQMQEREELFALFGERGYVGERLFM